MWPTLILQLLFPLALVAWLGLARATSRARFRVQAAGTGLALLALALVAPWLILPWWLPWLYLLASGVLAILRVARERDVGQRAWPTGLREWLVVILFAVLGLAGASFSWLALEGRELPPVEVVDIDPPLGPGLYLVASGGSREIVNGHMLTLDPAIERFRRYRGQSYGVDLVEIDRLGRRADGLRPVEAGRYFIFGSPVLAPCAGTVVASRDDRPDQPVPVRDREVLEGNHVLLRCGEFDLLLAHFRRDSVTVETGDAVRAGDTLGVVGNSGQTDEPHLHVSAQRPGTPQAPLSGDPLALTIDGRFLARNDRLRVE